MPNLALAKTVRQRREALGLTRESLGRQAGTSTSTITRMENYGLLPRAETLSAIAGVLGLSLDELLRETSAA